MIPWKFVSFSYLQFAHYVIHFLSLFSYMQFEQKSDLHTVHSFGSKTIKVQNLQVNFSYGSY